MQRLEPMREMLFFTKKNDRNTGKDGDTGCCFSRDYTSINENTHRQHLSDIL